MGIGTVNISGPRAALQRRRRKCGSLTGVFGYRFLCTTSATLWPLAKPLKSALVQARKWFGTQQVPRHCGRETYIICVSKLGGDSNNGLSSVRCQVIIWTNAGLIVTGPLGTYLSEIVINAIFIQEKNIENVVCKTEVILSWSQCVNNNNNVAHWSHSGLNINDGGLRTVAI